MKKGTPKKNFPPKGHQVKQLVKTNRYFDLIGLAAIILLGVIIYSNSFNCSFHFDDLGNIVNNPKIQNLSDVKAWWNFVPSRPLGNFTFALNYHFNKLDVRYYHLVNLIIHLTNACLVWWLTLLIFSCPALKDQTITRQKKVIAFFTALLFVSHPLATQSVTYIVQRLASMVAMFYLLSLSLYIKARLSDKSITSKYMLFAGSFISAMAAMLTKENAFTLPFAIVLVEFFFLKTKKLSINLKDWRVILLIAAFLGIIIIIPIKLSFSIFDTILPIQGHPYTITPINYLFTQFSVIVKYIQLLFLPINQKLEYDFPISTDFFEIRTLICFLVLLFLVILAVFLYKRYRIISFGIFWFFLTLSIESSFIPIPNVIFEHRTYLPSVGFFLIFCTVIYGLLGNRNKVLASVIIVIIVIINSYLTYDRNKVWKDDLTFWNDNVEKNPNLPRALSNRGCVYEDLGEWSKAIADFTRAIEFNPNFPDAYTNRASVYGHLGQWDMDTSDCSSAIKIDPKFARAYYNRGIGYGNFGMWGKAIADYSIAIQLFPEQAQAYSDRGLAYSNLGKWDKAIADYSRAIGIDRKFKEAYYNRGIAYWNLGQKDRAITDYTKAIEIDPGFIKAWSNRGVAFAQLGQLDKAIADFSMAIGINSKYIDAYLNRGAAYVNLGQYDRAITDFSKIIEMDPNNTKAYSFRAIAYEKMRMGAR